MALALEWGTDFIHMNECGVKDVHQLITKAKTKFNSISYMLNSFYSPAKVSHKQLMDIDMGVYFQQTPN